MPISPLGFDMLDSVILIKCLKVYFTELWLLVVGAARKLMCTRIIQFFSEPASMLTQRNVTNRIKTKGVAYYRPYSLLSRKVGSTILISPFILQKTTIWLLLVAI